MSEMSFGWRGESSNDHGIVVTKLPPAIFPGKRTETIVVPGRSGTLHIQDGAWDEILLPIECYLPYEQGGTVSSLETLAAWLQGQDWLTLSNRPNRRFRARLYDPVTLSPLMEGFDDRIFALSFWADPFAYEAEPTVETHTAPFVLTNPGTVFAEPLIELTATGEVSISIGDQVLTIADVPGSAIIDVPAGLVYHDSTNLTGLVTTDDWPPQLPLGETAVAWIGDVTQVKIQPNWRWL